MAAERITRRLFAPFALAFAALIAAPLSAEDRVMVGYYATFGDLPVEQIPWPRLTHLCHAFLRVDAQGKLVKTDAMPNAALTADARKNDVPTLLVIGGGVTVRGLEKATATAESTKAFTTSVMRVLVEGKYDGVDLDWEHPRDAATRDAHARLVLELRRQLDTIRRRLKRPERFLLTVAVSPSGFLGQWIDAERIAPAVDWLGVMAYDMSGPWSRVAAHHAPLFASSKDPEREWRSVAAAMRYWEETRGVPKEKLVVGTPLYGRGMPAGEPYEELDNGLADEHRALPFSAIRERVGEGWPAEWDNESRAPWLRKPRPKPTGPLEPLTTGEDDGPPLVIGYDDRNSVHGKAAWAREQGYHGLFFWAIHQDRMPDERHWLLDAANKAWPAE